MNHSITTSASSESVWSTLQREAAKLAQAEPILASLFNTAILRHDSLNSALSFLLASKLDSVAVPAMVLREVFEEVMSESNSNIVQDVEKDILAICERDAACDSLTTPLLFF